MLANFLAGGTKKMIQEAIIKLSDRIDLTYDEAAACVNEIMDGKSSQVETAAFLMGLAVKGETVDEIAAAACAMRDHATPMPHEGQVLEIVGTGGDRSNTINVSTTAALVIASGGVQVAKHGNVAASSKSGAANVLDSLGVNTRLAPEQMKKVLADTGICFMHAQVYHAAMKYVAPVRKALGCHTVFNVLGPLTNPACNEMQVMGVYKEELVQPMADVLSKLGVQRGVVIYGQDVMDEASISAPTTVCEFAGEERRNYVITPEEMGLKRGTKADVVGGDPDYNAQVTRDILSGKETGPRRDIVVLNAGLGLYVAQKATSIKAGVALAQELIDSGKALAKLDEFAAATQG
jgi:anthranilate phosphoribosyltransferase